MPPERSYRGPNPTDDLTRGKPLADLAEPNRWTNGPPFLLQPPEEWPKPPTSEPPKDTSELRRSVFCGITTIGPDLERYKTLKELIDATAQALHGAASAGGPPSAVVYQQVKQLVLQRAHIDYFPAEYALLSVGKPVPVAVALSP